MPRFGFPLAAALLVLAGCDGRSASPANDSAATAPAENTLEQGGALVRTLTGNGLEPGFPFGMAQAEAVAAATAAFGEPSSTARNDECGAGPLDFVSFDALTLAFQEGRFAGWAVDGPHPSLRTAGGLAVGAPRSVLGDTPIEQTTLGQEFEVGGIGGLLDENDTGVAALWAGLTCHFR